jgi:hypothetical protein
VKLKFADIIVFSCRDVARKATNKTEGIRLQNLLQSINQLSDSIKEEAVKICHLLLKANEQQESS